MVPLPAQSFTTKWPGPARVELGGSDKITDLFVRDNEIFVYSRDHYAFEIDRETGVLKHSYQVARPEVVLQPPVILKDYLIFPTTGELLIYDRQGSLVKHADLHGRAMSTATVGSGTRVYFGADVPGGGREVCMDVKGSEYQVAPLKWELLTRGNLSAAPATYQGMLFVADTLGNIYAVNAENRRPVWALSQPGCELDVFGADGPIKADICADDFGVYAASMDTKLYCLQRTTGMILWQYFAGTPLYHPPVASASTVYILVDGVGLVALDKVVTREKHDQKPKWIAPHAVAFLAEDEKLAYLRSDRNFIMAVDKTNGELKFSSKRNDFTAFSANPKDGTIYAATEDGRVYAIVSVLKPGRVGEQD